jgi:extracellular matrix protein 14
MKPFFSDLSFSLIVFVLALCPPIHAFTVPWAAPPNSNGPFAAATEHHAHQEQQESRKLRNVFPQLTWLRDTAIEKVFGLPPKPANSKPKIDHTIPRPLTSQLPTSLLAKYGGDVVLRFNISTPYEEQALEEVADDLFLDVWEFTNNWADIRLREDDVCYIGIIARNTLNVK